MDFVTESLQPEPAETTKRIFQVVSELDKLVSDTSSESVELKVWFPITHWVPNPEGVEVFIKRNF